MTRPGRLVVVTGTGTEIGKTWVGAALARVLRARGASVAARKPAQSFDPGDDPATLDASRLAAATGEAPADVCPEHRSYPLAMAPPMAADALGRPPFSVADLATEVTGSWPDQAADVGLVEGAGGVAAPQADDGDTVALIKELAPDLVVLVAPPGLGTINLVRLSVAALAGWPVAVHLNPWPGPPDGLGLAEANRRWLVERDGLTLTTTADDLAALPHRPPGRHRPLTGQPARPPADSVRAVELTPQLAAIDDARERLVAAAASPDLAVPSCPGWDVADLAWHVGVVGDIWSQLVDGSLAAAGDYRPGERPDAGSLPAWLDATLGRASSVLAGADPAAPVPTWAEPVTAGFVQRRLAHELTMHAWDADLALGQEQPLPVDLAEDGIDELLSALSFFRVPVPDRLAAGEGIHLHCTDDDLPEGAGEWVIRGDGGTWSVDRRHAKEAFAARGPASGLLLALWGRAPVEDLATFGDRVLLDQVVTGLRDATGGRRRP